MRAASSRKICNEPFQIDRRYRDRLPQIAETSPATLASTRTWPVTFAVATVIAPKPRCFPARSPPLQGGTVVPGIASMSRHEIEANPELQARGDPCATVDRLSLTSAVFDTDFHSIGNVPE